MLSKRVKKSLQFRKTNHTGGPPDGRVRQEITALAPEGDGVISVQGSGSEHGEQDWIQETVKRPVESFVTECGRGRRG